MREVQLLADALNRLVEAEPGLDADDEQIERVGQAEADPVLPLLRQAGEHHARQQVAERAAASAIGRFGLTTIGVASSAKTTSAQPRRMPKNTAIASWLR